MIIIIIAVTLSDTSFVLNRIKCVVLKDNAI